MLFVYNPLSGKGLIRSSLSVIIEKFTVSGFDVTVHPTQSRMDAADIVRERAPEFEVIVCSGGDGTLDEVVTGVMQSRWNGPIGYIPAGSTNDFGASLGLPKQMEDAADIITLHSLSLQLWYISARPRCRPCLHARQPRR